MCQKTNGDLVENSLDYTDMVERRAENVMEDKLEQVNCRRNDLYTFEYKSDSVHQFPYRNEAIYPVKRLKDTYLFENKFGGFHQYPCQNEITYPVKRLSQAPKNVGGR